MSNNIVPALNPLLSYVRDIVSMTMSKSVKIPSSYRDQVLEVKKYMKNDMSGLVSSSLDFAIHAALVDFVIETENKTLNTILNDWLVGLNGMFVGKLPIGVKGLEKEYNRERLKGSSFLVLRTEWENVDGYELPVKLWFVDGENLIVEDENKENRVIGTEKYYLYKENVKDNRVAIQEDENHILFVQKPYSSWSELYSIPFLIQRGLLYNLKFYELLNDKGINIVSQAIEYIFSLKKGSETLAGKGDQSYVYSKEDLVAVKEKFQEFMQDKSTFSGSPVYVHNFDTEFNHIIPDFAKIINESLFHTVEKRLMAGLGFIEMLQTGSSSVKNGILNPKPFIAEVQQCVYDFKSLLSDILYVIAEKNSTNHRKHFSNTIKIHNTGIDDFLDSSILEHIRSMYDRGVISMETYVELVGVNNIDFDIEKKRLKLEKDLTYIVPHPTQPNITSNTKEDVPASKQGVEKVNFKSNLEESYYKTVNDLPSEVKDNMDSNLRQIYMDAFNSAFLAHNKNDTIAAKIAWSVVSKHGHKNKEGKWVKEKAVLEKNSELENLQITREKKQIELLNKLLEDK